MGRYENGFFYFVQYYTGVISRGGKLVRNYKRRRARTKKTKRNSTSKRRKYRKYPKKQFPENAQKEDDVNKLVFILYYRLIINVYKVKCIK